MNFAEYNQNCRLEGHQERPIWGICVNAKCQEQRAICFICSQSLHHGCEQLDYDKGTKPWILERMEEYQKIQASLSGYSQKIKSCFSNLKKILEEQYQPVNQLQYLQAELLNKRVNGLISLKFFQEKIEQVGKTVEYLLTQLSEESLLEYKRGKQDLEVKKNEDKRLLKIHPTSPYNLKGYHLTSKPPPKPSDRKPNITTTKIIIKNDRDQGENKKNNTESNFFTTRNNEYKQHSPKRTLPVKLLTHNKNSSLTVRHKTMPGPQYANF